LGPTKNRTISVLHDDDQNLGTIEVINECSGLEVTADLMLRQVFQNLIDNSLKHGEKVRHISLHCTKDKDGVKLFYKDDGVGVPKTNKSKLFDAGFSTGKGNWARVVSNQEADGCLWLDDN